MKKEQYRFKTQLFSINGIHNIPGLVINSGYGYRFQTFCCKECGEIYVANLESLENKKFPLMSISEHENCPNCNSILKNSLFFLSNVSQ